MSVVVKWPYVQSSAIDVKLDGPTKTLARLEALDTELTKIGARRKSIVSLIHDESWIEIDCPNGRVHEARLILARYFPQ